MAREPRRGPEAQIHLPPGFRFYPSDEELVVHYLCKRAASQPFAVPIIAEVDLYKFDPWDLPDKALFGEKEWYFFSPRDRKYPNGSRPNRAAGSGYWKATGTDKPIVPLGTNQKVAVKKALVFYKGRAPKGLKTNWIMHEYRLADSGSRSTKKKGSLRLDDWVLCRIYKRCTSAQKAGTARPELSGTSGLDEVLASLPDIEDSKLANLPGLNSLRGGATELQDVKPISASASAQYYSARSSDANNNNNLSVSSLGLRCRESGDERGSSDGNHELANDGSREQQSATVESAEDDSVVESTFTNLLQTNSSVRFGGTETFAPVSFGFDGLPSTLGRSTEPSPQVLFFGDGTYNFPNFL